MASSFAKRFSSTYAYIWECWIIFHHGCFFSGDVNWQAMAFLLFSGYGIPFVFRYVWHFRACSEISGVCNCWSYCFCFGRPYYRFCCFGTFCHCSFSGVLLSSPKPESLDFLSKFYYWYYCYSLWQMHPLLSGTVKYFWCLNKDPHLLSAIFRLFRCAG